MDAETNADPEFRESHDRTPGEPGGAGESASRRPKRRALRVGAARPGAAAPPHEHGRGGEAADRAPASAPPDSLDEALAVVGPRLRQLRQERDATLGDLAQETGISVSTLSRLESGARRPTLELLLPLARAYGVTLDELVDAPETGDPRIHIRPLKLEGRVVMPLTRRAGGIQAYKVIVQPSDDEPEPKVHEGYEWLYVLDGRLRLVLGKHDLVLGPGEAAEFDTRVPHWFGTADGERVEILSLFGKQGERVHFRASTSRVRTPPAP